VPQAVSALQQASQLCYARGVAAVVHLTGCGSGWLCLSMGRTTVAGLAVMATLAWQSLHQLSLHVGRKPGATTLAVGLSGLTICLCLDRCVHHLGQSVASVSVCASEHRSTTALQHIAPLAFFDLQTVSNCVNNGGVNGTSLAACTAAVTSQTCAVAKYGPDTPRSCPFGGQDILFSLSGQNDSPEVWSGWFDPMNPSDNPFGYQQWLEWVNDGGGPDFGVQVPPLR
jgi:hypothetical protein